MVGKNKNKQASKILFYFAIALFAVSLVLFFVNIDKFFKITGKATGTGTANLTVESLTNVNFTTNNINWGSGSVTSGKLNATLDTSAGENNVTNGNWTGNTAGLILENIGNQNVTLLIKSGANATELLEGNNPSYQFNLTNSEPGSCTFNSSITEAVFFNATTSYLQVCDNFDINQNNDTLRVDVLLRIPYNSKVGAIGDIITVTATAVTP